MTRVVELLSPKLARIFGDHGHYGPDKAWVPIWTLSHWCPACSSLHEYAVEVPFNNGAQWTFDGNVDAPSFNPSMNITLGPMSDGSKRICHYYLTAGEMRYQGDCTHALSGQTVSLPDFPEEALNRFKPHMKDG